MTLLDKRPCYQCEKRHPCCHASCRDYLDWKEERDAAKEAQRKAQEVDRVIADGIIRRKQKQITRQQKQNRIIRRHKQ